MTNAVLDFRASRHGFHFPNRFVPGRVVGSGPIARLTGVAEAGQGLCGGMAFTVRDLFEARVDPPPDRDAPTPDSPRYRALFRRQVESFDWFRLPIRFWILGVLHADPATWWSRVLRRSPLGELTRDVGWPAIRDEIDAGRLAQVGLIRHPCPNPTHLTRNHQVLAYAYRAEPDAVTIRVYDPNWPDRDDVELRLDLTGAAPQCSQSTGEPLHGFFLTRYAPARPRAWLRPG